MKIFSIKNNNTGFTLVETLVAVAIFSVSVAAVISVTASSVASTTSAKNRIVGNYLAQETIEYIRHFRNKYSAGVSVQYSWNDFLDNIAQCDGSLCVIPDPSLLDPEVAGGGFEVCSDQIRCDDFPIYLEQSIQNFGEGTALVPDNGYYYQSPSGSSNDETSFRRYFTIELEPLQQNEMKVIATVFWVERNGVEKNITLSETLTNWLPN